MLDINVLTNLWTFKKFRLCTVYTVGICAFTSVCWWKWQQYPQDTVQKRSLMHTLRFHMTGESGGNETGMSNSARNDWTWPEPAQLKVTWWSVNWQAVQHCNRQNADVTHSFLALHPDSEKLKCYSIVIINGSLVVILITRAIIMFCDLSRHLYFSLIAG